MNEVNNINELDSVVVNTASLVPSQYRFRAIALSNIEGNLMLINAVRASGFRQHDSTKPQTLGLDLKLQIETNRNEVAVAFIEAEVPENVRIDYLFQIINVTNQRVIRTYTTDFTPLRSRTYTWIFDGRDFLTHPGERSFAEEGYYIGRIQLRSQGQSTNVFFGEPIRIIHRAARFLVMDGWNSRLGFAIAENMAKRQGVPTSNILEKLILGRSQIIRSHLADDNIKKQIIRRWFLHSGNSNNYADILMVVTQTDNYGKLKSLLDTTSEGFVVFNPLKDSSKLRWINTPRWVLLIASGCLGMHRTNWVKREELEAIVPVSERNRVPESENVLATFHPGAHWLNCIRSTGLRGILGYWGKLPSFEKLQWVVQVFVERLQQGENFLSAWRQANSAVSRQWAVFIRKDTVEDTLQSMSEGLPTSSSNWKYWDEFKSGERFEVVYQETNRFSDAYRSNETPVFHPIYDREVLEEEIPSTFGIYNEDVRI